jgi:hypothetical protein
MMDASNPFVISYVGVNLDERVSVHSAELKRAAMLFDTVLVTGGWSKYDDRADDMWDLQRAGVIQQFSIYDSALRELRELRELALSDQSMSDDGYVERSEAVCDLAARAVAQQLAISGRHAVPLVRTIQVPDDMNAGHSNVLRVILHHLPLPDGSTPWPAILDWRRDDDATSKFRRLRHWVNGASRRQLTAPDAYDELATLVDDYSAYMAAQHRKIHKSRFEAVATTTADVGEDLAKFRVGSIVRRLCELNREDIVLLEAELRAPGREVAYIVAARERFGRRAVSSA